jgi:hypothetical protein
LSVDQVLMVNKPRVLVAPQRFNAYSYSLNNPITRCDPSGNEDELMPSEKQIINNKEDKAAQDAQFDADNGLPMIRAGWMYTFGLTRAGYGTIADIFALSGFGGEDKTERLNEYACSNGEANAYKHIMNGMILSCVTGTDTAEKMMGVHEMHQLDSGVDPHRIRDTLADRKNNATAIVLFLDHIRPQFPNGCKITEDTLKKMESVTLRAGSSGKLDFTGGAPDGWRYSHGLSPVLDRPGPKCGIQIMLSIDALSTR